MILKYLFDKTASIIGLLLLWPVLLVVAILIRVKMPGGPVMFTQQRVGRHGHLFRIYKFRTMDVEHGGSSVSVKGESRITPIGARLRRYKLDELPELWNVLRGDMSFVGPRPDVPGYADQLQGDDRRILQLRPGITGPATLKYRNEEELLERIQKEIDEKGMIANENDGRHITSVLEYNDQVIFPDKVRLNLYYLDHYSFAKDIQMLVCTVFGKQMTYAGELI